MAGQSAGRRVGTVVIGGGQAGLAAGYHLARLGEEAVILDAEQRVGDAWRRRWRSLRVFTPAQHDGLPGLPFPAPRGSFPTKDEVADYLEGYAARFQLPVRSGVRVARLSRAADGYRLQTSAGELLAARVVLATGTHPVPHVPAFAAELPAAIRQLHSSEYQRPDALPPGEVVVVGAGTSGVEIALEVAAHRPTTLAGRPTPHIPDWLLRYAGGAYWWFASHVLTMRTPIGRKARRAIRGGGGPLIRVSVADLDAAGVRRVPRVAGVAEGRLRLDDGRLLAPAAVVWATGFRPDYSWVDFPLTDESGWPSGRRGVSDLAPGVYFVGVPFQFGLTSGLLGGMGRDAAYVAARVVRDARRRAPALPGPERADVAMLGPGRIAAP